MLVMESLVVIVRWLVHDNGACGIGDGLVLVLV